MGLPVPASRYKDDVTITRTAPLAGSQGTHRKSLTLRARLYLLAIVVIVPTCIYIAHGILTDVASEFRTAEQLMTVLARITAVDTEQFLGDSRVTMTRISRRMVMAEPPVCTSRRRWI